MQSKYVDLVTYHIKEKYVAVFSEASDPIDFAKVSDTEGEAEQFLWDSYNKATWRSFGGWNQFSCIPQHYILPKYKGIIADCAKVMAKKGQ